MILRDETHFRLEVDHPNVVVDSVGDVIVLRLGFLGDHLDDFACGLIESLGRYYGVVTVPRYVLSQDAFVSAPVDVVTQNEAAKLGVYDLGSRMGRGMGAPCMHIGSY